MTVEKAPYKDCEVFVELAWIVSDTKLIVEEGWLPALIRSAY